MMTFLERHATEASVVMVSPVTACGGTAISVTIVGSIMPGKFPKVSPSLRWLQIARCTQIGALALLIMVANSPLLTPLSFTLSLHLSERVAKLAPLAYPSRSTPSELSPFSFSDAIQTRSSRYFIKKS